MPSRATPLEDPAPACSPLWVEDRARVPRQMRHRLQWPPSAQDSGALLLPAGSHCSVPMPSVAPSPWAASVRYPRCRNPGDVRARGRWAGLWSRGAESVRNAPAPRGDEDQGTAPMMPPSPRKDPDHTGGGSLVRVGLLARGSSYLPRLPARAGQWLVRLSSPHTVAGQRRLALPASLFPAVTQDPDRLCHRGYTRGCGCLSIAPDSSPALG